VSTKQYTTFNTGGTARTNIAAVEAVYYLLDCLLPGNGAPPYHDQIAFVEDRPSHGRRYAVEIDSITTELD